MQPITISRQSSLRLNTHSRSLWISFLRLLPDNAVVVILYDHNRNNRKFNLHLVNADAKGIEIKIPHLPTGIYRLKIKDGKKSFTRQIAIQ